MRIIISGHCASCNQWTRWPARHINFVWIQKSLLMLRSTMFCAPYSMSLCSYIGLLGLRCKPAPKGSCSCPYFHCKPLGLCRGNFHGYMDFWFSSWPLDIRTARVPFFWQWCALLRLYSPQPILVLLYRLKWIWKHQADTRHYRIASAI